MTHSELSPALGIDVGGTNIRGAMVTFSSGEPAVGTIQAYPTPQPSTPDAVAEAIGTLRHGLGWDGPEGINDVAEAVDFCVSKLGFQVEMQVPAFASLVFEDLTLWLAGPRAVVKLQERLSTRGDRRSTPLSPS